jgi:DNA-binding NtrC family response regulator
VLVADDEPGIRFVLREALEATGSFVIDVDSGDAALEALAASHFDVAFFDIRMPGPSGLDLLERARSLGPGAPAIVIITAQHTFENAVEAMKRGALDYLLKPFGVGEAQALVEKALRSRALEREVRALRREVGARTAPGERLVGRSSALLEVFKTVGRVARSDVPVLVTGESGTGKELVARAIHGASPRAEQPFVPVNSAAIPRDLLESELFGHERGAFTGATESRLGRFREATGGTLFLDEIGDMPLALQAKLLRVLQSGEVTPVGGRRTERVDVRIIAATHRDVDAEVREGRFREDLFYRLNVIPIALPPLRDRRTDIPLLVDHFLAKHGEPGRVRRIAPEALEALVGWSWPGNVRELESVVERTLLLTEGDLIRIDDLPAAVRMRGSGVAAFLPIEIPDAGLDLERLERDLIKGALEKAGGNVTRAARLLGLSRRTLQYRLEKIQAAPDGAAAAPNRAIAEADD